LVEVVAQWFYVFFLIFRFLGLATAIVELSKLCVCVCVCAGVCVCVFRHVWYCVLLAGANQQQGMAASDGLVLILQCAAMCNYLILFSK
jgi:hypothetical protein